jgi:hypothetical protein
MLANVGCWQMGGGSFGCLSTVNGWLLFSIVGRSSTSIPLLDVGKYWLLACDLWRLWLTG